MYHASTIKRAKQIIKNNSFGGFESKGKQQWLGDGVYLYRELFYAHRWIDLRVKDSKYSTTKEDWTILRVEFECSEERIFNLDSPDSMDIYWCVCSEIKKHSIWKNEFNNYEFEDGFVINWMFANLGYLKMYDAVTRTFVPRGMKEAPINTRFNQIPEFQCCIKNINIITDIDYYINEKYRAEFSRKMLRFNKYRGKSNYNLNVAQYKIKGDERGNDV